MSTDTKPARGTNFALLGGGLLMVVCCAVGPAVIGAVAGSAIGGWLGIACAVVLAAAAGLVLHRRIRSRGGC
jgi:outer membrane lipoprotein SlyB